MAVRVYLAQAMTGRTWLDVCDEAIRARNALNGLDVFSPSLDEALRRSPDPIDTIPSVLEELQSHWKRDKAEIVKTHVVVDLTPHLHSHGVSHEIGFARYCLWKPVVRIMEPTSSVAYLEDDLLVPTVEAAAEAIQRLWGTRAKRWAWRSRMLLRSLPKWLWRQLRAWS